MPAIEAIHRHASIRQYLDKPVSDCLLNEIIQAGIRTFSSGNMQAYSIVVTHDPSLREQLYKLHMEQSMVRDAADFLYRSSPEVSLARPVGCSRQLRQSGEFYNRGN